MDQTKNQENESLKQEIRRLRQQMIEMHRAWACGLPPPPFSFIDPTNTVSFPPKYQSYFSTVVDAPQHEDSEKMVGKMKSAENSMKNSLGPAGEEDVSYKDWGLPSRTDLPLIFEMSKFEEQDRHEESVKHLGPYCNQLREPGGKKNEKDDTAIVVGEWAHPRRRRHRFRQSQA
ncbi:hypothetical protein P3L10_017556 [Capsicum annuum]